MSNVHTYSPKNMVIMIDVFQVTGFGDTDMVTVALDEPKFEKYTGVDGVVSRSHNVADTGTITFTLAQTSSSNADFSNLLQVDTADPSGDYTFSVSVIDNNSGTYYIGRGSWVQGMPESGYAKTVGTREWVVEVAELDWYIAGN